MLHDARFAKIPLKTSVKSFNPKKQRVNYVVFSVRSLTMDRTTPLVTKKGLSFTAAFF